MALHEQSIMDPHTGHVVSHDFAEYHIASNADVVDIEATWLGDPICGSTRWFPGDR